MDTPYMLLMLSGPPEWSGGEDGLNARKKHSLIQDGCYNRANDTGDHENIAQKMYDGYGKPKCIQLVLEERGLPPLTRRSRPGVKEGVQPTEFVA